MALVNNLQEDLKSRNSVHNVTDCKYFVFEINGNQYLQLDTFGSDNRETPGKVSQSVQFSPEALRQLKEIIDRLV